MKNPILPFLFFLKEIAWRIKLLLLLTIYRTTSNKIEFLNTLPFESLRRLAEFRSGLIKQEVCTFLKNNPKHNSKFQEWWFRHSNPEGIFDPSLKMFQKLIELINNEKNIKTFVDLGCNMGEVVYKVSLLGLDAVGVDFPSVIQRIKLPIKTIPLDLNKKFPEGTYDIIFCREVFEHVNDPDDFLNRCREIAGPRTFLFLSCPYTSRHFKGNAFHLRVLSRDELITLLKYHGFKILEMFIDRESNIVIAQKQ